MQKAPDVYADVCTKQNLRLQGQADAYLLNSNVAIYKAGTELLEAFNSVMGLIPRTCKFYERADLGANVSPGLLLQGFIKKGGVKAVTTVLTSSVPMQDLWTVLVHLPKLLVASEAYQTQKKQVGDLCLALLHKLESEGSALVSFSDVPKRADFMLNFNQLLLQLYTSNVVKERMAGVYAHLQIEDKISMPVPQFSSLASLQDEFRPAYPLKLTRNIISGRPLPQGGIFGSVGGASDFPFEDQNSIIEHEAQNIEKLREYADAKFKQCLDYISELKPRKQAAQPPQDLPAVVKSGGRCDQQELAVLTLLEMLLTDNDLGKASKLLQWRKKVLQVAANAGWKTAKAVAVRTVERLDISPADIAAASEGD